MENTHSQYVGGKTLLWHIFMYRHSMCRYIVLYANSKIIQLSAKYTIPILRTLQASANKIRKKNYTVSADYKFSPNVHAHRALLPPISSVLRTLYRILSSSAIQPPTINGFPENASTFNIGIKSKHALVDTEAYKTHTKYNIQPYYTYYTIYVQKKKSIFHLPHQQTRNHLQTSSFSHKPLKTLGILSTTTTTASCFSLFF